MKKIYSLPQSTPSLERVSKGALCSGCGACSAIAPDAIEMQISEQGFHRPKQVAEVAAACDAAIQRVCPGLTQVVERGERLDDPLWGPYVSMQIGWATDPEIRFQGSSGGAISAMIAWMIESEVVSGALANTADPERAIANVPFVIRSREDVMKSAGSRYAPSSPLAHLPNEDKPLAFVGKPCDVAAFRALAKEDSTLDTRFPIVISFFCAGVPSLFGAEELLEALGTSPEKTESFRYRGQGWPGFATAKTIDGKEKYELPR